MEDFEKRWAEQREEQRKHIAQLRADLRKELLTSAILGENDCSITAEYYGNNDSGQFDDWSQKVPAEVEDFFHRLLSSHHDGWENNDGGQGTITWDLSKDVITIEHGQNYMETNHTDTVI